MEKNKTLRRLALGLFALALPIAILMDVSEGALTTTAPRVLSRAESTQLYTIHQGPRNTAVESYLKLAALRDGEGLEKVNDTGSFVYLNFPDDPQDQLIEVRLPVTKAALARQGTLGDAARAYGLGTTDVKTVPASTAAAISKPLGASDPTPYYSQLYNFVASRGLTAKEAPVEQFSAVSTISAHCAYSDLATELSVATSTVAAATGIPRRPASTENEGRQ